MIRSIVDRVLETSLGYQLNQKLANPTVRLFKDLIKTEFPRRENIQILDIGCGTANYRNCFNGKYTGLDINPAYVRLAATRYPDGQFVVMSGAELAFKSETFDEAFSIATTHHLTDDQLVSMAREALRVVRAGGHFHVFDAILPLDGSAFKSTFFRLDRGRFPREAKDLLGLLQQCGRIEHQKTMTGFLHDVIYISLAGSN
ncbi:MAG TPA: class I SAM-dependent methyltransferase [Bradyrhizobium sp.]|nr:class I SAM-dependent methyltransferase [Bradyrhizobium sp.]